MYNLITKCNLKVKKITSSWPHKDNCYEVEITDRTKAGATHTNHFFDRNKYHLIEKLQYLRSDIGDEDLKELVTLIENYGQGKYDAGSSDESMSSEDI
jgi:hypothetical protein